LETIFFFFVTSPKLVSMYSFKPMGCYLKGPH